MLKTVESCSDQRDTERDRDIETHREYPKNLQHKIYILQQENMLNKVNQCSKIKEKSVFRVPKKSYYSVNLTLVVKNP